MDSMLQEDYYATLGVSREATPEEIRKAYRQLALKWHPDKNREDSTAEQRFKAVAEAYDVLSDPERRQLYDRYGHEGLRARGYAEPSFTNVEDIFSHFADVFEGSIFEGLFGGGMGGRGRGARSANRGADLRVEVEISLEEVLSGTRRTLQVRRQERCNDCGGKGSRPGSRATSCPTCGGYGQVESVQGFFSIRRVCPHCQGEGKVVSDPCPACRGEGRRLAGHEVVVDIPAGVRGGNQLRLRGEGDAGRRGGQSGDLLCVIVEHRHEIFQRDGDDIVCQLPISFADAALGAKIEMPTLKGRVKVAVPAGTQSGEVLRLKGQGLPRLEGGSGGSLLVQVIVETPRKLTAAQRKLLEELKGSESRASQPETSGFLEKIKSHFQKKAKDSGP